MNKKIRSVAIQAFNNCSEKCDGSAWVWEETFAKLIIDKSIKFLKDINADFEAEQLENFWHDDDDDEN